MSNYFDNQQQNWSWNVHDGEVKVVTHHSPHHPGDKPHSHTVNVTKVPIGEMVDNTGEVMGKAHRAALHDYADNGKEQEMNKTPVKSPDEGRGIDDNNHGRYSINDGLKRGGNPSSDHQSNNSGKRAICSNTFPYRVIAWENDTNNSKQNQALNKMRSDMGKQNSKNSSGKTSGNGLNGAKTNNGFANSKGGKEGSGKGTGKTGGESTSSGKNTGGGISSGGKGTGSGISNGGKGPGGSISSGGKSPGGGHSSGDGGSTGGGGHSSGGGGSTGGGGHSSGGGGHGPGGGGHGK